MFSHDPVSCDQVTRELAVPIGEFDQVVIDQHLAGCPSCAHQQEQLRRVDRLWQATRPSDPGEAHWQRLWTEVEAQAAAVSTATLPPHSKGHRGWTGSRRWGSIWAVAAVAQAAAVLLAAWLFLRPPVNQDGEATGRSGLAVAPLVDTPELAAAPPVVAPVQVEYELEEGQTLFLVLDARGETVVVKPRFVSTEELVAFDGESPDPYASAYQMTFVMLNAMEGMEGLE